MASVAFQNVEKSFGNTKVIHGITFEISDGEFMVLVGPSGCGKSTLLRMLAGLEEISGGVVTIDGKKVNDVDSKDRDIAMVFQSYALYPHMTVRQNLAYGLKVRRTDKAQIGERVQRVARMLQLESLLDRRPAALSGGQRQRVAMGRAIVREPQAFLMDEPLSNLDAKLRVGMRAQLAALHARLGTTTVYVTHDQTEAMTLGRRVAVMRDGRLQQVDAPQTLYRAPANLFVAGFIGSPAMNLVEARLEDDAVVFGAHRVPLARDRRPATAAGTIVVGIRPEAFEDAAFAAPDLPQLEVDVTVTEELGADLHALFTVAEPPVRTDDVREAADDDDALLVADRSLFTARVDVRSAARPGARLRLAVDPRQLHFFDPATGRSVTGAPARAVGAAV